MNIRVTAGMVFCLTVSSVSADQISIPNPPQANTKARAAEMKANLDTIVNESNSQDLRIEGLERGLSISTERVDCSLNAAALKQEFSSRAGLGTPLAFEIIGVCELDFFSLFSSTRQVKISGFDDSSGLREEGGGGYGLMLNPEYSGGHLILESLKLYDPFLVVSNGASARLSDIQIYSTPTSILNPLIAAASGGTVDIYPNVERVGDEPVLQLRASAGGHLRLAGPTGSYSIEASNGASVACNNCDGAAFGLVDVKVNSSFCLSETDVLNTETISVSYNSSLIGNFAFSNMSSDSTSVVINTGTEDFPCG